MEADKGDASTRKNWQGRQAVYNKQRCCYTVHFGLAARGRNGKNCPTAWQKIPGSCGMAKKPPVHGGFKGWKDSGSIETFSPCSSKIAIGSTYRSAATRAKCSSTQQVQKGGRRDSFIRRKNEKRAAYRSVSQRENTPMYALVDGLENPNRLLLTGGEVHEGKEGRTLLEGQELAETAVVGDKVYGATPILTYIVRTVGNESFLPKAIPLCPRIVMMTTIKNLSLLNAVLAR